MESSIKADLWGSSDGLKNTVMDYEKIWKESSMFLNSSLGVPASALVKCEPEVIEKIEGAFKRRKLLLL